MLSRLIFVAAFLLVAPLPNAMAQGYVQVLPDEVKNPFFKKQERILAELSKPPANY